MDEKWSDIVKSKVKGVTGHTDVKVSNLGNIKGKDSEGKKVGVVSGKNNRRKIHLSGSEPILVYSLVADLFLEPPVKTGNEKFEIHHIDKDSSNDAVTNLKWVTVEEHVQIHKND